MKPLTREWVEKAEADYAAALLLRRTRRKRARDIVCYHLQQTVEKYLKARLEEDGINVPRTHDLELLLEMNLPGEPLWESLRPALAAMTDYAVEIRYPGRSADVAETRRLLLTTEDVRQRVRQSLGMGR